MGKARFDFSGQVVAITGAGKGIGKGAAVAFAEAGARVFALDHTPVTGETTAKVIRDNGGQAAFIPCDVADTTSVTAAFERIDAEAGRLDVLVNSAGGFSQGACSSAPSAQSRCSSARAAAASSTWARWPGSRR